MNELQIPEIKDLELPNKLPIDQNPAIVFIGSKSKGSQRTYTQSLNDIASMMKEGLTADTFNWGSLRFSHTQALKARLAEKHKPSTVNKMLAALRGVLKTAWQLGQMNSEDYHKAASIKSITGETLPAGRALTPGEIAALFQTCENDDTILGARDAALLACCYPGGLRRSEIVKLDLKDYDPENKALRVRNGKRNKERQVYINNGGSRALDDWISIRGNHPGPLLLPIRRGGHFTKTENGERTYPRMTTQSVYYLLRKRGEEAGIKDFSPHDMRRTFISDLLENQVDISVVAKLAGHSSVDTTTRYDMRPEKEKQKAVQRLHIPYRGRSKE